MKTMLVFLVPLLVVVGSGWLTTWATLTPPDPRQLMTGDSPAAHQIGREHRVQGIGYVEPVSELRRLVFKANGVIARCQAEIGRTYKKGDILMELDNDEQRAELDVAEAEWTLARADQAKALSGPSPHQIEAAAHRVSLLKEQERYWTREHERYASLASRNSATKAECERTATELNQRRVELREAEAELRNLQESVRVEDRDLASARVGAAKSRLELARQHLEQTILRAPFDGTVLEILKRDGDGARLLDPEPVAIFADTSRLRVRAEIDERYIANLAVGQKSVCFGRGLGDRRYPGRIVLVKPVMGKKTVFSHSSTERKDLDVIQVLCDMDGSFRAPIGLEVDVVVTTDASP
jgi:HlyD family secretion protein